MNPTQSIDLAQYRQHIAEHGPIGIRRLAVIKKEDGMQVIFSDDTAGAPLHDTALELIGAVNMGHHILIGRQDIGRDTTDGEKKLQFQVISEVTPKLAQPFAASAIVDEQLQDNVYELFDREGNFIVVVNGLDSTEIVDQDYGIQAFAFINPKNVDEVLVYAATFDVAAGNFMSEKYFEGMKYIAKAPKGTKLMRTKGKVRLKYVDGKEEVYNLDGTIDKSFKGLVSPPGVALISSLDENGRLTNGLTISKFLGDEHITSYNLDGKNLDGEDAEVMEFKKLWDSSPIGKAMQKMQEPREAASAK